jgi:class 3 adenylate cyclase
LFSDPVQAIRYALDLRTEVGELGYGMRAGVHVGEVLQRDGDIAGLAVHAAARVSALAPDGHVYVSRSVTDLVAGSGLDFLSTGHQPLKGLPGSWEVFDISKDPAEWLGQTGSSPG